MLVLRRRKHIQEASSLEEMGPEPLARAKSLSDLNKLPKGTGV